MHGITDRIVHAVIDHWLSVIVTVVVAWLVKNRYHNGLNKYPGPFLASLTDWWRFFDVYGQRPDITHQALHKKHGDVVRLGPNTLSFSDPKALKTIYGLNKGFIKVSLSCPAKTNIKVGGGSMTLTTECSPISMLFSSPSSRATACRRCSAAQTTTSTPSSDDA